MIGWFHSLANFLLRIVLRIVLKLEIRGLENTPREGSLIVAINHTSFLDPVLAGAFLPRVIHPMAKVELFRIPVFGAVVRAYGAFPVNRGQVDRQAIHRSLEVLRAGGAVLVAPEGTRSKDGGLLPGRRGVAMLALHTGATILPVAIWGLRDFWRNLARLRRTPTWMVVGEPFRIVYEGGKPSREELKAITDEIMYRLAALLPPEHRGIYSDVDRVSERYLVPVGKEAYRV
jgi:1-acyl-sn-glycerol-3-phosphate acyltransferase